MLGVIIVVNLHIAKYNGFTSSVIITESACSIYEKIRIQNQLVITSLDASSIVTIILSILTVETSRK